MKFWTIDTIADGVPSSFIYYSRAAAEACRVEYYKKLWRDLEISEDWPEDVSDAHALLSGEDVADGDLMWMAEHKLDLHELAGSMTSEDLVEVAKAQMLIWSKAEAESAGADGYPLSRRIEENFKLTIADMEEAMRAAMEQADREEAEHLSPQQSFTMKINVQVPVGRDPQTVAVRVLKNLSDHPPFESWQPVQMIKGGETIGECSFEVSE